MQSTFLARPRDAPWAVLGKANINNYKTLFWQKVIFWERCHFFSFSKFFYFIDKYQCLLCINEQHNQMYEFRSPRSPHIFHF
jgi:hypothetical protein